MKYPKLKLAKKINLWTGWCIETSERIVEFLLELEVISANPIHALSSLETARKNGWIPDDTQTNWCTNGNGDHFWPVDIKGSM